MASPSIDSSRGQPQAGALDTVACIAQATLGDLTIGIDTRFVVHAIARPARLSRLPRSHDAIDGVFASGDKVVPVVDLRRWMGEETDADSKPAQVMILSAQGRTIGLAIDEACGVERVPESRIRRIHQAEAQDGFFHSVAQIADETLLSLLDPEHLMNVVQAWTEHLDASEEPVNRCGNPSTAHSRRLLALVKLGGETLGIASEHLVEVLDRPAHQSLIASDRQLRGMIEWRGNHIPLVDVSTSLGLTASNAALAMVIVRDTAQVAVMIDAVVEITAVNQSSITPTSGAAGGALTAGHTIIDHEQCVLVLDTDSLLCTFAAPGLINTQNKAAGAGKDAATEAYAVFDAGRYHAIPMRVLETILRQPALTTEEEVRNTSVTQTFIWQAHALRRIDLREQAALEPCSDAKTSCVMIVRYEDEHIALVIHDVVEMLFVDPNDVLTFQIPGGNRTTLITASQEGMRASYPVIDLGSMRT